jgi:hypothetical protein
MSITGERAGRPCKPGPTLGDTGTDMLLAISIVSTLTEVPPGSIGYWKRASSLNLASGGWCSVRGPKLSGGDGDLWREWSAHGRS